MIAGWQAIAGAVFLLFSGVAMFVRWRMGINKKYQEAEDDTKKAIDAHDFNGILDGIRRMRNSR